MPITQTRLLALVTAAQDYQRALADAANHISAATSHATPTNALDILEELRLTYARSAEFLLAHPGQSPLTIGLEAQHLRDSWRKNQRSAARMQRKRDGLPSGTAPEALGTPRPLPESLFRQAKPRRTDAEVLAREREVESKFEVEGAATGPKPTCQYCDDGIPLHPDGKHRDGGVIVVRCERLEALL